MASAELARTQSSNLERAEEISPHKVTPLVDIYENNSEVLLIADLPGVPADGLEIKMDEVELRIEGHQKIGGQGGEGYNAVTFARTFRVSEMIRSDGIQAEIKNGVLSLHMAKHKGAEPRRIEVKVG